MKILKSYNFKVIIQALDQGIGSLKMGQCSE